jgi:hypothetical protein
VGLALFFAKGFGTIGRFCLTLHDESAYIDDKKNNISMGSLLGSSFAGNGTDSSTVA